MTSNDEKKTGRSSTGRGRRNTGSKPQSAQARARAAKKAVTIDLEAKDVTPPSETKSTTDTSKEAKPEPAKVTSEKATAKPPQAAPDKRATGAASSKAVSSSSNASSSDTKDNAKSTSKEPANSSASSGAKTTSMKDEPRPSSKAPTTPPSSTAPKSSGSFFPNLVASIIGGIIAVLGFIGLQLYEIVPNFGDNGVEAISERVSALEDAPSIDAVSQNEFVSLSERLDEIEEGLENAPKQAIPEDVSARLTALEARLASRDEATSDRASNGSTDNGVTGSGDAALTTGMSERLAAIEARLSARENAGIDTQLATLDERLATLNTEFAALQSIAATQRTSDPSSVTPGSASQDTGNAPSADVQSQLTALQQQVAVLQNPEENRTRNDAVVTAAKTAISATLDPKFISIQTQLDEAATQLGAVQDKVALVDGAQGDLSKELTSLSDKIGSLESALDAQNKTTASVQTATKSLALDNLKQVAENGGPFESALASLQRVGVDPKTIATLQPFSVTGLKDTNTLKSELSNLITLAAAKKGPSGEAPKELTALEKLARNAKSLIKIRSVDGAQDTGPFGQLQAAFDQADMDSFLNVWGTLSDDQKTVFNQWLVEWKGNLALSSLIATIEKEVAGLPASKEQSQ